MRMVRNAKEQLLVFLCFYVFFLLTFVANFSGPHDSIYYLNWIVKGDPLFHEHHLLYHFTAHYWFVGIQKILPGVRDYYLVESFTAIWGSCNLVLVYTFFRKRFLLPVIFSLVGTSIIAFSYGVWLYSVNIEVYTPPLFFILLSLYIMTKDNFSKPDVWKVALLHSLAVLFHQINILFFIVVLYKYWEHRKKINFFSAVMKYLFTGLVLVGGMYFLVGWVIEGKSDFHAWIGWIQGYANTEAYWQPLSFRTPLNVMIGFGHAFVGGHFIFQVPYIEPFMDRTMGFHSLDDEIFISRNLSSPVAVLLTILTIVLATFMVIMLVRLIRKYKRMDPRLKRIGNPLLLCIATYSVFFCFWMPEILEFWILQTILVWILLIGLLPEYRFPFNIRAIPGLVAISILLFVINFFGSMKWLLKIENDLYYRKVEMVKDALNKNDVILLQDGWILGGFFRYFTKTNVLEVPISDSLRLDVDRKISSTLAQKGKVYVYPEHHSKYILPDRSYVDSLLRINNYRTRLFHGKDPIIWVIE